MPTPLLTALLLLAPSAHAGRKPAPRVDLEDTAAQLIGRAMTGDGAWNKLEELCDDVGHRLSGSPNLDKAVAWGAAKLAAEGLTATTEPCMVPTWVRGREHAVLLTPTEQPLDVLLLGGSVGTPAGGITADVLVVHSWDELEARGAEATGKIVLYDVPFTTYGETVPYRGGGAVAAAKLGAVAAMVRSVTPVSLGTPHTGAMRPYQEGVPAIPAVAVTIEASAQMARMAARGLPVRVHLDLEARKEADRPSANVVGEVRGREKPEESVILGCHLDSWDVGQGAQDDGAGCAAVMEAGRMIAALPVPPRRSVRVVLFVNEENGLAGGRAYAEAHGDEPIVAALEMDTGSGQPLGWRVDLGHPDGGPAPDATPVIAALEPLAKLLAPLGAGALTADHSGADIGPLVERGVLGLGLAQDTTNYWPIHHTRADTLEKVDPDLLRKNVAVLAATAWWLAEVETPPVSR